MRTLISVACTLLLSLTLLACGGEAPPLEDEVSSSEAAVKVILPPWHTPCGDGWCIKSAGETCSTCSQDCGSCCGNKRLDPGEHCDFAIPAGQPGACPTSCPADQQCTTYQLVGSAGQCTRRCEPQAPACSATADGCCPAGCNGSNDPDCANCNNGALELGEACDARFPRNPIFRLPRRSCDSNVCITNSEVVCQGDCTTKCSYTYKGCSGSVKDLCCPAACTHSMDADCAAPADDSDPYPPPCKNCKVCKPGQYWDPVSESCELIHDQTGNP